MPHQNFIQQYEGFLAFIGALLALFALLFAFIQYKDAKKHTHTLKQLVEDLTEIKAETSKNLSDLFSELTGVKNELSTTYLSEFPDFLPEINAVIESAKTELLIVCDFPSYSYFSDYDGWMTYHHLINTKTDKGVAVTMICLAKKQSIERIKEQFLDSIIDPSNNAWNKRLENAKFQKRLKKFIQRHDHHLHKKDHHILTPTEVPFEHFLKLLVDATDNILKSEFLEVEILETKSPLSIFCWIADGQRAVFAIPRSEADNAELGFKTSDKLLIGALKSIFKSYKKYSISRQVNS
jgi:hypothetical protein